MLKSGDKFVVVRPLLTFANKVYEKGDILELLEPTGQNPWEYDISTNWMVKCKFFHPPMHESVWGGIQECIDRGLIRKKTP